MNSTPNRAKTFSGSFAARPPESGGKRAALQTLRAIGNRSTVAKRLDCGGFSIAVPQPSDAHNSEGGFHP
jgi:hypothetical protein